MTDLLLESIPIGHVPALGRKAIAAARRAQTHVALMITQKQADYVSISIERLVRAPRKGTIEFWLSNGEHSLGAVKHDSHPLSYSAIADLIPVAVELYLRWPPTTKPSGIVLLSDGHNLLFNPGRPAAQPRDILDAHALGQAPMMHVIEHLKEKGRLPLAKGKLMEICKQGLTA